MSILPSTWLSPDQAVEIDEIVADLDSLPNYIVLDTAEYTRDLSILFGPDAEFVLSKVIDAISNRMTAEPAVGKMVASLTDGLKDSGRFDRHRIIDMMATVEMCALDILYYLRRMQFYTLRQYLPYRFETLMLDGSILIRKVQDFEELCDSVMLPDIASLSYRQGF